MEAAGRRDQTDVVAVSHRCNGFAQSVSALQVFVVEAGLRDFLQDGDQLQVSDFMVEFQKLEMKREFGCVLLLLCLFLAVLLSLS